MGYLSQNCAFAPLTEQLHEALTGFDCQREPAIQDFFRNEAILNAKELMSKSYCFYKKDTMQAVAAFCVINTDISVDLIPKSTRNKLNRKIPYAKQRDHYPAVLIGQIAVFDAFAKYHLGNELMDSIKWWLRNVANLIAARYVVVDAVNNEKVLQFYARNQFWTVFKTEEDERKANELEDDQPLLTRFMISDLK
ncbi:MAG: N-acetyltransferase [Bacteroidaceae bacterium]|nr:N-acetyltransferase [Bacteroidaceae bacterium]